MLNTTDRPPEVIKLELESRVVSLTVAVEPEAKIDGEPSIVTVDWASDTAPGVTVIVGNVDGIYNSTRI